MIKFNLLLLLSILLTLNVNAQQAKSVKHAHNGKAHAHVLPNNGVGRHNHGRSRANVNRKGQPVKHAHNGKLHWHILPNNGRGTHRHRGPHNNANASALKRRIRHNYNKKTYTHILPNGQNKQSHRSSTQRNTRNKPNRSSAGTIARRIPRSSNTTQPITWNNARRPSSRTQAVVGVQKPTEITQKPIIAQKLQVEQPKKKPVINYQQKPMYVDASRLNVRNEPNKKGKVVWTLKRDQKVQVTKKDGNWLYIENSRFVGWVFGTFLTNAPTPKKGNVPDRQKKVVTEFSTAQIKEILIKRSHAYYRGNCPCPYNTTSRGRSCGGRSAWSRPGGASPLCYNRDVTNQMVSAYKARQ